ncbi:hypothetical protein AKJ52_00335 [candidate division MSBL1 archaeon SCGC-AAA382C18]|uniref:Flavodoxin-like domain-containing protein n=1 Tax=candidate division MSBL1 archaeon SCGC-AAA382C18 TaxID=1698281 RepID=A0A133VLU8_9EURY|nr:hypothetical protein AKJ52_00335 [candidate division MSBL1 archaeon SCGC-AAA382C18]
METLIVCKSYHHGNTWKVAESMAGVLDAEIIEPEEDYSSNLSDYDLLGFGSGIYWASFHGDIFDFVQDLPVVEGKKAFIFSTSGMWNIPIINGFGGKIRDRLSEKGFEIVGGFSCGGYNIFFLFKLVGGIHRGKPNEENLKEAKEFARRIEEKGGW